MKKFIFAFCTIVSFGAFAAENTPVTTATTASATVDTAAGALANGGAVGDVGQGQTLNFNPVTEATKIPRGAVNTAVGSQTITSNDTCMGSTSGGITTYGISISAGTTWTDNNCIMLKNSRELWNMGLRDAAVARMCMDADNRDALEVTGVKCPDFDAIRKNRNHK